MNSHLMLGIWVLLAAAGPVNALRAIAPSSQPSHLPDDQLRRLVSQLGDRSYLVRESASRRLAELDAGQLERLAPLFQSATIPEQRIRLRNIVQDIFIAARQAAQNPEGFLGVTHMQSDEAEQPAPQVAVMSVVPDSPAEKAGLRPGDVIIELDGRPVRSQAEGGFAEQVRQLRPGQTVALTVLRAEQDARRLKIVATLGNRGRFNVDPVAAEWTDEFNRFWKERFDPQDQPGVVGAARIIQRRGGVVIIQGNVGPIIIEQE